MVIKEPARRKEIEKVIEKGGSTKVDKSDEEVVRFTLSIPKKLADMIDQDRSGRVLKISRHRWVVECILNCLEGNK